MELEKLIGISLTALSSGAFYYLFKKIKQTRIKKKSIVELYASFCELNSGLMIESGKLLDKFSGYESQNRKIENINSEEEYLWGEGFKNLPKELGRGQNNYNI